MVNGKYLQEHYIQECNYLQNEKIFTAIDKKGPRFSIARVMFPSKPSKRLQKIQKRRNVLDKRL